LIFCYSGFYGIFDENMAQKHGTNMKGAKNLAPLIDRKYNHLQIIEYVIIYKSNTWVVDVGV
jgi:hypothetical protein